MIECLNMSEFLHPNFNTRVMVLSGWISDDEIAEHLTDEEIAESISGWDQTEAVRRYAKKRLSGITHDDDIIDSGQFDPGALKVTTIRFEKSYRKTGGKI